MINIRRSSERGHEDRGWLNTHHTFSFDTYYDPNFMHYRTLRVMNEDRIQGGKGFSAHSHHDMEIITFVLEGAIEHKDSLGNVDLIKKGDVQRMSAGTGVVHSEYNLSPHDPAHFIQIWIYPEQHGIQPSYEKKTFSSASKWGQWCLLASNNGRHGSIRIHQDADLYSTILDSDSQIAFQALQDRFYWIQVLTGQFVVLNHKLYAGDGAAISEESLIPINCKQDGELLLFDLA